MFEWTNRNLPDLNTLVQLLALYSINLYYLTGRGLQEPPLCFYEYLFLISEFCLWLLCIFKQMENTHFGKICISGTTLDYILIDPETYCTNIDKVAELVQHCSNTLQCVIA